MARDSSGSWKSSSRAARQAAALIDRLGKDDVSGELLLLYSLHPDALETRVQTAVERMRPRLRKLACTD